MEDALHRVANISDDTEVVPPAEKHLACARAFVNCPFLT